MTTTVKLSQLKPGHEYPGASLNARVTDRDQDIAALKASIKADGLLQSLLVCPGLNGKATDYYVIAGNRRLAALRSLVKEMDVPVIVREDVTPGSALALSLAENITQVPLHPVDRYETFAALVAGGKTEADIAAAYAIKDKTVKQSLALGRLSPKIREAWRAGKLDAQAAQTYTLVADHKRQDAVYEKLKKQQSWQASNRYNIKQALLGDQHESQRLLKFVGRDAYEKAGGKIQTDLFAGQRRGDDRFEDDDDGELLVSDPGLLKKLADDKIGARAAELKADGWSWAEHDKDLPDARRSWKKHEKAGAKLSADVKAKTGCILWLDGNGKLNVDYGVYKGKEITQSDRAAIEKGGKPAPVKSSNTISNSLRQDLTAMAARATKDALVADSYGDELALLLARIVAEQITPERFGYMPNQVSGKLAAIRNGITPKVMAEALQKRFDRKRYFASAPKTLVLKAITESVKSDEVSKLGAKKKSDVWKFALANVPKTWLPPELRTAHYDGPKAAAKKPTKPKKKAA